MFSVFRRGVCPFFAWAPVFLSSRATLHLFTFCQSSMKRPGLCGKLFHRLGFCFVSTVLASRSGEIASGSMSASRSIYNLSCSVPCSTAVIFFFKNSTWCAFLQRESAHSRTRGSAYWMAVFEAFVKCWGMHWLTSIDHDPPETSWLGVFRTFRTLATNMCSTVSSSAALANR